MPKEKEFPVYGDNGLKGTLLAAARFLDASLEKRVRLDDGREIMVPSSALLPQPDGSYYLKYGDQPGTAPLDAPLHPLASEPAAATSSPVSSVSNPAGFKPGVASQPASSQTSWIQSSAASSLPAQPQLGSSLSAAAAAQLFREDCDVERIPIKRIIDEPAEIRHEGDTLIVPLMEEVLVVEKKLMLREELHIKRRREQKQDGAAAIIPKEELQ